MLEAYLRSMREMFAKSTACDAIEELLAENDRLNAELAAAKAVGGEPNPERKGKL